MRCRCLQKNRGKSLIGRIREAPSGKSSAYLQVILAGTVAVLAPEKVFGRMSEKSRKLPKLAY